jgi:fibronectin type 3 domain-containing protein
MGIKAGTFTRTKALLAVLGVAFAVAADSGTLSVSNASVTGMTSGTSKLNFPVVRSGATGYNVYLAYHTVDGSAKAGIDYTAASGAFQVQTSGNVPVTIPLQNGAGGADKTLQLMLDGASGIGPPGSFDPHPSCPDCDVPNSLATADINGDGKPDLIVPGAVLLNTTAPGSVNPEFTVTPQASQGYSSIAVADINGDGKPDLIALQPPSAFATVWLNTTPSGAGTPAFAGAQLFGITASSPSLVAADINGDGKPDLIVTNTAGNRVSVLLNTTAAGSSTVSFAPLQSFVVETAPNRVAVADINGDGSPDLVVMNQGKSVSVLLNTTAAGSSTASLAAEQVVASFGNFAAVADLNGDGKPDLIIEKDVGASGTLAVLLNTTTAGSGAVSFAAPQTVFQQFFDSTIGGSGLADAVAVDLNGDGTLDLLVEEYGSQSPGVAVNNTAVGASTVNFVQLHSTFTGPSAGGELITADVNGDGMPDAIGISQNSRDILVWSTAKVTLGNATATGTIHQVVAGPTNLSVTCASGQTVLNWTALPGDTSYNVYDGTSPGGEASNPVRSGINSSTTTITGLTNGTTYYFTVKGLNAAGLSAPSNEANTTPNPCPAAPGGLTATRGNGFVTLNWNSATGASSYDIYQGTTAGGESQTPVRTGITGTHAIISGLANGTTYYFKVRAVNSYGAGAASNEASATPQPPPMPPTGLSALAENAQVSLSWTASAGGADNYRIYMGTSPGGELATAVQTSIAGTTATVSGLSNDTTYYFVVKAVNYVGISGPSNEAGATPFALPAAPTNLAAHPGNGSVSLSWSAAAGASSYNIYAGTSPGGESATPVLTGLTQTNAVLSGLSNGTKYYLTVRGVNSHGTGNTSGEASATPIPPPATPASLAAVAGNGQVTLTWNQATGAANYRVYMGTSPGGESATAVQTGVVGNNPSTVTTTVTGLSNFTTYYFVVKAVNYVGFSGPSNEASATPNGPPAAPTNLQASPGSGKANLTWTAVAGATSYNVYEGTAPGGEGSTPVLTGAHSPAAQVPGLTAGTTYYFKITAMNSKGESPRSNEASTVPRS